MQQNSVNTTVLVYFLCRCMVVNTFGSVLLTQQFLPRLLQRFHRSAVINVSSENGNQPIPGMAVSSGAKAFVKQFTSEC